MYQNKRQQILLKKQPNKMPFLLQQQKTSQRRKFLTTSVSLRQTQRKGISLQRKYKISIQKLYPQSAFQKNQPLLTERTSKGPSILTFTTICTTDSQQETTQRSSIVQVPQFANRNTLERAKHRLAEDRRQQIKNIYYQTSNYQKPTVQICQFQKQKPLHMNSPQKQYLINNSYFRKVVKF